MVIFQEVESMYANLFERGDLAKARNYLRSFREQTANKPQVFMIGLQMGINVVLLVWMVWLLIIPSPGDLDCPYCAQYLSATLPVFRILLVPVVGVWAWALCVRQWERNNINYIYILEMSAFRHKSSFTHFKFAANALTLWLATFVMYVAAIRTGVYPRFLYVPPTFYPPLLFCAVLLYSLWPSSSGNSPKNYFWPAVLKTTVRPFGSKPVGFMENLVADMLTSAVIVLRDIGTSIAFYIDGGLHGIPTQESPQWLKHVQGPLITMLPYWWRLMQCLRRCYDAPSVAEALPQLVNAGKYVISLISIAMAVIGCEHGCSHFYSDSDKWSVGRCVWFSALVCGTLYSYVWDITMDWSLIEQVGDGRRCCFGLFPAFQLRRKRGLSWTWFYYWAAVANLVGRLSWAISINPNAITSMHKYSALLSSPQVRTTLVAVVEMLRRGQWTLLRVENEFLSNASHYRGVTDVPVLITFAEMTLGRAHIHTRSQKRRRKLMGKEGVAILLAIIATAAAATVVYIATQTKP
uniref:EXS domain-containing protein n=1 Tax=Tetraselmis chuii TaxID=63592 RepID=A0A7S1SW56_9CHLO|mmetsp:Transcript_3236/g.5902  ORF Transcript_3236/g.5902 Transcript_3236/m.5902 type:complete len:521 (+) Transcript_3236:494-2056(+)